MNKVFVWYPKFVDFKKTNVGHASLQIGHGRNTTEYVSFWPVHGVELWGERSEAKPFTQRTYEQDVEAEGETPDYIGYINCLDERLMRNYWADIKRKHLTYSVAKRNCSDVVVQVLLAGGARLSTLCNLALGHELLWTPVKVPQAVAVINSQADVIMKARQTVTIPSATAASATRGMTRR